MQDKDAAQKCSASAVILGFRGVYGGWRRRSTPKTNNLRSESRRVDRADSDRDQTPARSAPSRRDSQPLPASACYLGFWFQRMSLFTLMLSRRHGPDRRLVLVVEHFPTRAQTDVETSWPSNRGSGGKGTGAV